MDGVPEFLPLKRDTFELIYVGRHFFTESGSHLGTLYHINGKRTDWGKVAVALDEGEDVFIRCASKLEFEAI